MPALKVEHLAKTFPLKKPLFGSARPGVRAENRAIEGLEYWMWEDEDEGLRIAGARSDIWDTSFTLLALGEAGAKREVLGNRKR